MNLANKITFIRIGLIPLFIIFLYPYPTNSWDTSSIIAAAIFLIAAVTDQLDGYIARTYNQVTRLGMLLDPLADKLLICAALIILVQNHKLSSWIAVVIIAREMIITGIRIVAASKGIALAADRYGKIKLVVQVAAVTAVILNNQPFQGWIGIPVDQILMYSAAALTIYSGYNYIKNNMKRLELHL